MATGLGPLHGEPQFGICQNMLPNDDMASDLDLLVAAGVRRVGILGSVARKTGMEQTARLLRERSLQASSYLPYLRLLKLDEAGSDEGLREAISASAALGAPYFGICAGPSDGLSIAQADERLVARLQRMAPLAREHGVRMALEPVHPLLRPISYVHTLRHAADIAARVDGLGLIADVVHLFWDREFEVDVRRSMDRICAVQVSNLSAAALEEKKWVRAPLNEGVIPVAQFVAMIDAAGYRGCYEDETMSRLPPAECLEAVRAVRVWFEGLWGGRR